MNIRKIKRKGEQTIKTTVAAEDLDWEGEPVKEVRITSRDEPLPEFLAAYEALGRIAMRLIGAPERWRERATVGGISINHEREDSRLGAVVTLLIGLDCANSPLVINTPHLRQEMPGDEGGVFMPPDMLEAVETMIAEARRYLDGERAQGSLFGEREESPPAQAPDLSPAQVRELRAQASKLRNCRVTNSEGEGFAVDGKGRITPVEAPVA